MTLYGSVPVEPDASNSSGSTRVQIQAPGGRIKRVFLRQDKVRSLYAVAANDPLSEGRPFELASGFPKLVTLDQLDQTLEEAGLVGSQVTLRHL